MPQPLSSGMTFELSEKSMLKRSGLQLRIERFSRAVKSAGFLISKMVSLMNAAQMKDATRARRIGLIADVFRVDRLIG